MKTLLTAALAAAICLPAASYAAPYCEALMSNDALPQKYAKRGPFYSDVESGWIIGQDQLKANFEVSPETQLLWGLIKDEFAHYGSQLVILAAPPRPLFAEASTLSAMGVDAAKRDAQQESFAQYISALNAAGIPAPDLSKLIGTADYYFARDTHWTPKGAATSAAMLAEIVVGADAHALMNALPFDGTYEEKGSLSSVVEAACGTRPVAETAPAALYAKSGTAESLFGDAASTTIALVGTSFSDRYKRDAYQVADAVAYAFDASVDNYSLTGGGLVGAMLAFVESGALQEGAYQTVVWESPYTAPLTNVDGLRQVLGALRATQATETHDLANADVSDEWVNVKHSFDADAHRALAIDVPGVTTGQLSVELITSDGEKARMKLTKTDRIAAADRTDSWTIGLSGLASTEIARVKLRLVGAETAHAARLTLLN